MEEQGYIDGKDGKKLETLVIFDIDGTLTDSDNLHGFCFIRALADVFDIRGISTEVGHYVNITDAGIMDEVCRLRRGRPPSAHETGRFRSRFLELLAEHVADRGPIRPMEGAADVLDRLLASGTYGVAYASGSWKSSALFKLRSAGLPADGVPCAFSDDDHSREGICAAALGGRKHTTGGPLRQLYPSATAFGTSAAHGTLDMGSSA